MSLHNSLRNLTKTRLLGRNIFTNKKTRSVCLSVCLSGYTFRHALMSHTDILNIDRGHIFRKHRHRNNKKVAVIYEKAVKKKNCRCQGICPPVAMGRVH